jgi:FtsP/CotA-like multicopper oxidase with cupredoxin domain
VPFVAPTIEVAPGETVRLSRDNKLPAADPSCPGGSDPNIPHCFNMTNLHAHGLWVSPAGNSDNVLVRIAPGVKFQYEYNVPLDHPSGTYWYHPHLHGSTALQVSSGMAGFLIVRGERLPAPASTGDLDTLLHDASGARYPERLLLFQQIQYACNGAYNCQPADVGGIESYDLFGPGTWPASGRYTSINGEVQPLFAAAVAGRLERWRLAHAGVRDTIKLVVRKKRDGAPSLMAVGPTAAAEQDQWIAQNCTGAPLAHFAAASDGLTRGAISERTVTVLQPGYREDLLFLFPDSGSYCVIDDQAPAAATVNALAKSRKILGEIAVGPGQTITGGLRAALPAELVDAVNRTMPPAVRQGVVDEHQGRVKWEPFVHADVADPELTGKQSAQLRIDTSDGLKFEVDGVSYEPDKIRRTLRLGAVEEWTLTAGTSPPVGHPFHIHVNPFQIQKILNPAGQDVSVTGEADDPQYAALQGVWRDTIFVKPGYKVITRTRYQRYIGDFVLHCHILDHEDQGMMQNVRIGLPDGQGGVIAFGHH